MSVFNRSKTNRFAVFTRLGFINLKWLVFILFAKEKILNLCFKWPTSDSCVQFEYAHFKILYWYYIFLSFLLNWHRSLCLVKVSVTEGKTTPQTSSTFIWEVWRQGLCSFSLSCRAPGSSVATIDCIKHLRNTSTNLLFSIAPTKFTNYIRNSVLLAIIIHIYILRDKYKLGPWNVLLTKL